MPQLFLSRVNWLFIDSKRIKWFILLFVTIINAYTCIFNTRSYTDLSSNCWMSTNYFNLFTRLIVQLISSIIDNNFEFYQNFIKPYNESLCNGNTLIIIKWKREKIRYFQKIDLRLIIKTFTYINRIQVILMRVCVFSFQYLLRSNNIYIYFFFHFCFWELIYKIHFNHYSDKCN